MKTIVVDDDVYEHLLRNTEVIGESASSILRRLLGLGKVDGKTPVEVKKIFPFLDDYEFIHAVSNSHRFLHILSWAFRKHPDEFGKVLSIEGRSRKYFAGEPDTLLKSGVSVNPRQIPDSPFWVVTNSSTAMKKELLFTVFRMLGYDASEIGAMISLAFK